MRSSIQGALFLCLLVWGCTTTPPPSESEQSVTPPPALASKDAQKEKKAAQKAKAVSATGTPPKAPAQTAPVRKRSNDPAKGKTPTLPPSRFRLSTLRAPELQVHKTPAPPKDRVTRSAGPSTNADLKEIVTGISAPNPIVPAGSPPVERINDKRIRIGRVIVDQEKKHIEIEGAVNMTDGILEYYAVGPSGKIHESVLTYSGLASQAHLGLLLLGLEPRRRGGPKVDLSVQWTDPKTGKERSARASNWLRNRATGKVSAPVVWRFHGSGFFNGRYAGDTAHTLVGLVGDPNVVIALDADSGNPYQGANQGFEVMTQNIPPKGTPVTLIIKPKA